MSKGGVSIFVFLPLGIASRHALNSIVKALRASGMIVHRISDSRERVVDELLINFASGPPDRKEEILKDEVSELPEQAESFVICKRIVNGRKTVCVLGYDDIGLMYGIFELLGQIENASSDSEVFEAISPVCRSPKLAVRSVCMFLYNRDLEREWLYSSNFWNSYFELLARSRFNYFSLIFGSQTSYLAPLFPFMINVPGYKHIKVPSYTDEERMSNLKMLKTVSMLAEEWGINFVLGIWQQHAYKYGENMVEGLTYDDLFDYCPKALSILLNECPNIKGVQFRMNRESGINEDDQERFYHRMLKAIRSCGRPMWIDLRAKGLRKETIETANALGLDFVVSTKFWCEHMGLPYFSTQINPIDKSSYRRYGYWDLLMHNRPYKLLYRMWTLGSQKILLWGDLGYAKRFAESCHLGDALGFEVCAPLSQKGYLNWSGGSWRIMDDQDLEYYQWEFERYWAFYMAFGLEGYTSDVPQPIFRAEFCKRFGNQAVEDMQRAYQGASGILPLVTASHAPSASIFSYWPEMDTGGLSEAYIRTPPGDEGRFYSIFQYVDDYLGGKVSAKFSPSKLAKRFVCMADSVTASLTQVSTKIINSTVNKEFVSTCIDLEVLAELARYHALRILAGEKFQFFRKTGDRFCLLYSITYMKKALRHWKRIVELTKGVYYEHMVFNAPPGQIGHWKDELPFLEHDLNRLKKIDWLFVKYCDRPWDAALLKVKFPWYKQKMNWQEEQGVLRRWAGEIVSAEPLKYPFYEESKEYNVLQAPVAVIKDLFTDIKKLTIAHVPVRFAEGNRQLLMHASLIGGRAGVQVYLYYKVSGRDEEFISVKMQEDEKNVYTSSIPSVALGQKIYYCIKAISRNGITTFHGTTEEPHILSLRYQGKKPHISHRRVLKCRSGESLSIKAMVQTFSTPLFVHLHYRHLVQVEDWKIVDMRNIGGFEYKAVIPGDFICPDWDIMYALEVADKCGNAIFYPDVDNEQPFIVVKVESCQR